MNRLSLDLLNLFVESPGDFLYFLVMIALCQASLFMALGLRARYPQDRAAGRYTLALLGITGAWIVLLIGALYAQFSGQNSATILPPLERASAVLTLLLVGWVFLTADQRGRGRGATGILLILVALTIAGYTLTGVAWATEAATSDFNLSRFGIVWTFVPAVVAALAAVLMLVNIRTVVDAPLKMVYFLIVLMGYGITLFLMGRGGLIGHYAGSVRLALVVAMALLPIIVYRLVIGRWQMMVEQAQMAAKLPSPAAKRTTTERPMLPVPEPPKVPPIETHSAQLLKFLGMVLEASSPDGISGQIVHATLDVLRGDVGGLLRVQDANYADVTLGFDKTRSQTLHGMALNLDNQPTLVNALERREQRVLYEDRNPEEVQDLYTRLDINQIGPVYFQPLIRANEVVAVLMVANPYSERELSPSERELLRSMATISSNLLAISYEAVEASHQAEDRAIQAMVEGVLPGKIDNSDVLSARMEMQASLQLARDQIAQLSRQVMELKLKLDDERSRLATLVGDDGDTSLSISQRLNAITDEHRELREDRDRLTKQLQEAEAALHGATASDNEAIVNNMIEALRKEKDALLNERERLQAQLEAVQQANPGDAPMLVQRMLEEKGMLEHERNQLHEKLNTIQTQLQALGIDDGVSGLPGLIGRLYEERALLKASLEKIQRERDTLLTERTRIADNITNEKERDTFVTSLQTQLQNLAADREAALKQRDKMRAEREEFAEKINQVKAHRARLMAQTASLEEELAEVRDEQTRLRAQVQEVADARSEVFGERDRLMAEVQRLRTAYEQLEARAEGDPMRLQRLGEEGVNTLKQMVDELTADRARLESELSRSRLTLGEVEDQLSRSQRMAAVNTDESAQEPQYKPMQPDLMMGLVQELRTPMTSINGYVDLLLGESAGILGEMQRKFLQRVSANVSRLASMIEDLVNVTELDTHNYEFQPAPVDVVNLIENAITNASIQFREKGLGITLNLADDVPPIPADKDALTQIIGQMLTNAYLVSPPETDVTISAQRRLIKLNVRADHDTDCVFVSVEDRGGGIAMEDIPRVFVRKYKAENPLIAGLGDTGVGMSMAKALVEAHGGQLWLETRPGMGSIFSFALPLVPVAEG